MRCVTALCGSDYWSMPITTQISITSIIRQKTVARLFPDPFTVRVLIYKLVGIERLELSRISPYAPEAYVYTNFTISPYLSDAACFILFAKPKFASPQRRRIYSYFFFNCHLYAVTSRAEAMKIEEYVPKVTPTSNAKEKSLIDSPPKI